MDAELPGNGVEAVFPFSPQEKNSFSDVFVVGAYFGHGFEETSPPDFPPFLGISSPKSKASTVHSETSFLLPPPKETDKQENSGARRAPGAEFTAQGLPSEACREPCQATVFGGPFFAVRLEPAHGSLLSRQSRN